jgi:hypothetical protein
MMTRSLLVLLALVLRTNAFVTRNKAYGVSPYSSHFRKADNQRIQKPARTGTLWQSSTKSNDEAVVIDQDFRLAAIFLGGGLLLDQLPILQFTLGPLITLLGVLFLVQTFRIRFICDDSSFELLSGGKTNDNIVVGGENRWAYKEFVNYDFFPEGWIDQPQGPILVYFKETQTPSDTWNSGPGSLANSDPLLAKGAKPGQAHFFPALCNCQQLKAEWERRGCTKL